MTVDYTDSIVGWAPDPDNQATANIFSQALDSKTTQYARYRISHGRASPIGPICVVVVDGAGDLDYSAGNEPTSLAASPRAGGKFLLNWKYNQNGQPALPTGFKIYKSDGVGGWDLKGTVPYTRGGVSFAWLSGDNTHDAEETYKVRTYRTVSAVDYLTDGITVTQTADAEGPPAITALTATVA